MKKNDVENKIADALLKLMDEKSFDDITITEIVEKAGVSRVTYYRYFKTKEDIVIRYFELTKNRFMNTVNVSSGYSSENNDVTILALFLFFKSNIKANKCLRKAKLDGVLLNFLSTEFLDNLPVKLDKYLAYFVAGALYNVLIHWLDGDCKDPIEEVSKPFIDIQNKFQGQSL